MLELVWMLTVNGCAREEIAQALRLLLALPNFGPKEFEALCYATRWYEEGVDFGDAQHMALSAGDEGFCTFDKPLLGKAAASIGAAPQVTVL